MDEDVERGIVFTFGLLLGLVAMWLVFTTRGRQAAQQVLEAASDLAEDLAEQAGDLVEQASDAAGSLRKRLR
jgi:type II secretory pathway component PulM